LLVVEAPPRARVIRTILTELQRIASHLLWLGTHALDIGARHAALLLLPRARRNSENLEKYCGARLTTHAFRIGLQYEAHDTFEKDVERFCKDFEIAHRGIRNPAHAKPHLDWADEGRGILTAARRHRLLA